jgi:ribosomal protein S30
MALAEANATGLPARAISMSPFTRWPRAKLGVRSSTPSISSIACFMPRSRRLTIARTSEPSTSFTKAGVVRSEPPPLPSASAIALMPKQARKRRGAKRKALRR